MTLLRKLRLKLLPMMLLRWMQDFLTAPLAVKVTVKDRGAVA